jgi:hypothetical protein
MASRSVQPLFVPRGSQAPLSVSAVVDHCLYHLDRADIHLRPQDDFVPRWSLVTLKPSAGARCQDAIITIINRRATGQGAPPGLI